MTGKLRILGMMSGTSVDSIDSVIAEVFWCEPRRIGAEVISFHEQSIPKDLRARIFKAFRDGDHSLSLTCSLNFEIGAAFGEAASRAMRAAGLTAASLDAIASHGQTMYHIAPHMVAGARNGNVASTLQIGEGSVIAEHTGVPVICDFRVADMAAGGNGAPLVPFADFHLFSQPGETIVVQNIGGIANCTVLPASGEISDVIAFDTGPGNMMMDALVSRFFVPKTFDEDGLIGRSGTIDEQLLSKWMSVDYIDAKPPKTTGRELFGVQFIEQAVLSNPQMKPADLVATATAFTARSIVRNLEQHVIPTHPVSRLLLAGGGARNPFLRELIEREAAASGMKVGLLEDIGFDAKARECLAFAILGFARIHGVAGNVPPATGARYPALLGKVIEPATGKKLFIWSGAMQNEVP